MQAAQAQDIQLKPQQARFVRAYIETGNATTAAKAAGCKCSSEDSFRVRGSQLLKECNHPIQSLMAEAGIASLELLRRVSNGLGAKDEQACIEKGKVHKWTTPNWGARARFTDMAIKLYGGYPKQQMELPFEIQDGKINLVCEFATNNDPEAGAPGQAGATG